MNKKWISLFLSIGITLSLILGILVSARAAEILPVPSEAATDSTDAQATPVCTEVSSAAFDAAAAFEYLITLTSPQDASDYYTSLTAQQQAELNAYAAPNLPLPSKVFTDAGPFMPPVDVRSAPFPAERAFLAAEPQVDNEGIITSKTVSANPDGSGYTLRLESYVTGSTTTSTETRPIPVDVVLVLDQSGSMSYGFDGSDAPYDSSRQKAMQDAVTRFIDSVAQKYSAQADHRISLVEFRSDAACLQDWTQLDAQGQRQLKAVVAGLTASGATNVGAGMQLAESLMGSSGYDYTGPNPQRQKVVIVFTDGIPTTAREFSVDVADTAIASAFRLKSSGCTVYSVGIFNGADPDQLYGSPSGAVGSFWEDRLPFDSMSAASVPAGNRFLNHLSSNFPDAEELGLSRITTGFFLQKERFTITRNFERVESTYYLTANNSSSLNEIFQHISDQIQSGCASVTLGCETRIQDVISPYFQLPSNTDADIRVFTADFTSERGWAEDTPSSLVPTVQGQTITVTGFDFSKNYVDEQNNLGRDENDPNQTGSFYGRKLIVQIPIVIREGFLGGNDVPTNTGDSGIYSKDDVLMEHFAIPSTDVPIPDITVTAGVKNIYLLADLTQQQMLADAAVQVNGIDVSALSDWQQEFVQITTAASAPQTHLTQDSRCTITASIEPKTQKPQGTASKSASIQCPIHVFKPMLEFRDGTVYYGDAAPSDFSSQLVSTVWMHGNTPDTQVSMLGTTPQLTLHYTPGTGIQENRICTKDNIPVDVDALLGNENINEHTGGISREMEFQLIVRTCQLTICKQGGTVGEPYVFDILIDGSPYTQLTIVGNGEETIEQLPVGTYTIQEDSRWSWRYQNIDNGGTAVLGCRNPSGRLVCTNRQTQTRWLNGYSTVVHNCFGSQPPTD